MHPVARFARFAVTDPIGQHDEKFRRIERLILSEKFAGKFRTNELRAAARRPVHDENGVGVLPCAFFCGLPSVR